MSDDIEIRLQRVAGHARRGWLGDAARELGVTVRTIQRARSGYTPSSFMKNLEAWERSRTEARAETEMDGRLRHEISQRRDTGEEEHYLRGLADGFAAAIKVMRDQMKDPKTLSLLERLTTLREREKPFAVAARTEKPVGSIGSEMLARVAERLVERSIFLNDDLQLTTGDGGSDQRQIDLLVVTALDRIASALYENGHNEALRVAQAEEERLLREIDRIVR